MPEQTTPSVHSSQPQKKVYRYWFLFAYTLLVILWGAWVRISHSGDGCGATWPLCQGEFVPTATVTKTWVEYGHRAMSGLYGIFVLTLWFLDRHHPLAFRRKAAHWSLFFTIVEALLGAKLVLFGLVSLNQSAARTIVISLHQINSLLLSGSTFLWAFAEKAHGLSRQQKKQLLAPGILILIAMSGAWASLSTTLFPSSSLLDGLRSDLTADAHHIFRLRVLHPLFAIILGGGLGLFYWLRSEENPHQASLNRHLALGLAGAIIFGMMTLLFLSPVWMKLTHLLIAHLVWALILQRVFAKNT